MVMFLFGILPRELQSTGVCLQNMSGVLKRGSWSKIGLGALALTRGCWLAPPHQCCVGSRIALWVTQIVNCHHMNWPYSNRYPKFHVYIDRVLVLVFLFFCSSDWLYFMKQAVLINPVSTFLLLCALRVFSLLGIISCKYIFCSLRSVCYIFKIRSQKELF